MENMKKIVITDKNVNALRILKHLSDRKKELEDRMNARIEKMRAEGTLDAYIEKLKNA